MTYVFGIWVLCWICFLCWFTNRVDKKALNLSSSISTLISSFFFWPSWMIYYFLNRKKLNNEK